MHKAVDEPTKTHFRNSESIILPKACSALSYFFIYIRTGPGTLRELEFSKLEKGENCVCYLLVLAASRKILAMTSFLDRLHYIARFCCFAGLILLNGIAYYAPTQRPVDDSLLLFNISAGLYLAFIYRRLPSTRQVVAD